MNCSRFEIQKKIVSASGLNAVKHLTANSDDCSMRFQRAQRSGCLRRAVSIEARSLRLSHVLSGSCARLAHREQRRKVMGEVPENRKWRNTILVRDGLEKVMQFEWVVRVKFEWDNRKNRQNITKRGLSSKMRVEFVAGLRPEWWTTASTKMRCARSASV